MRVASGSGSGATVEATSPESATTTASQRPTNLSVEVPASNDHSEPPPEYEVYELSPVPFEDSSQL